MLEGTAVITMGGDDRRIQFTFNQGDKISSLFEQNKALADFNPIDRWAFILTPVGQVGAFAHASTELTGGCRISLNPTKLGGS